MKPVSKKRKAQLSEYSIKRKKFLSDHPFCQVWIAEHGLTEADLARVFGVQTLSLIARDQTYHMSGHGVVPLSTEVHHTNKRRGAMLNETQFWLAVCHENHERVESSKSWARANGFLMNF